MFLLPSLLESPFRACEKFFWLVKLIKTNITNFKILGILGFYQEISEHPVNLQIKYLLFFIFYGYKLLILDWYMIRLHFSSFWFQMCRTAFEDAFRLMYALPSNIEALPPMPEDGGHWSALHSWVMPTPSFLEFVMFSRWQKAYLFIT